MSRLLVYRWGSVCEPSFINALNELNIDYLTYDKKLNNYHADSVFAKDLIEFIHTKNIDRIFSYDYFPMISMVCEVVNIPYISWIYDCPQYTLYSKSITNKCNYIYCFDLILAERVRALGAVHCQHLPLATTVYDIDRLKDLTSKITNPEVKNIVTTSSVSFVGNLYNDSKNRIRNTDFDDYTAGYIKGLVNSQKFLYGVNLIKESLTDRITSVIADNCHLSLGNEYFDDSMQLVADAINMEVSALERKEILETIAQSHSISLFTGANNIDISSSNLNVCKYVNYDTEMPMVFYNSMININITSRSIESGIPLRIFDILGCGGFCMTNYQPEIAELFEDTIDLVMFTDLNDLIKKIDYYTSHENERKAISINGYNKVKKNFNLTKVLPVLLSQ